MFTVTIDREFCAAHALLISGVREALHGHNFRLTVCLKGPQLDVDGMLVDFHALEHLVDSIIKPMTNANLNDLPPFAPPPKGTGVNTSAELIARHIAEQIQSGLGSMIAKARYADPSRLPRLESVRLTEAPGCATTYFPA